MKIKVKKLTFDEVMNKKTAKRKKPKVPSLLFQGLIRMLSIPDLLATGFKYTKHRMDMAGEGPYLILMNHSSFIDLKIASRIFFPMRYSIICTSDGFVGKEWLMRNIGCIPTQKFVTDISLIKDMIYTVRELKTSILMYPEASYSFDGCATPLPRGLGRLLKKLDIPVITVITKGAFLRDPLYNGLRLRRTKVSADVTCLFTRDEVREMSVAELDAALDKMFEFDAFKAQMDTKTVIDEPFRATGLHRVLYKCVDCGVEGEMEGDGVTLTCRHCGKSYELSEYGALVAKGKAAKFSHIPDWYAYQRECVRREIECGEYALDIDVEIGIMVDFKAIYMVGDGRLHHGTDGFTLTGCDGKLSYTQSPLACYGLYADYFWYEIGDVICIGNSERLYYCFPKGKYTAVAKTRLATEELYKIYKNKKK